MDKIKATCLKHVALGLSAQYWPERKI